MIFIWPVQATQAQWWRQFNDPQLDAIIQQTLAGSHTLAEAKLREKKAQSQAELLEAGSQLQVAALGMLNRQRASANGFLGPYALDAPRLGMDGPYYTEATIGLFAGIDLDFGAYIAPPSRRLSARKTPRLPKPPPWSCRLPPALRSFTTVCRPAIRCSICYSKLVMSLTTRYKRIRAKWRTDWKRKCPTTARERRCWRSINRSPQ